MVTRARVLTQCVARALRFEAQPQDFKEELKAKAKANFPGNALRARVCVTEREGGEAELCLINTQLLQRARLHARISEERKPELRLQVNGINSARCGVLTQARETPCFPAVLLPGTGCAERPHDPRLDDLYDATLWKTAQGAGLPCRMVAHGAVEDTSGTSADRRAPLSHPGNTTHFRLFRSESDFKTIVETTSMLEESGFYWGAMTVEEAHHKLKKEPEGTFLIRDSQQKDVFFTLSYRARTGPVSVRIHFQSSRFSLKGSKESFDTLFQLLEHYSSSAKKSLLQPYRKQRVRSLQELCRKRIIETSGAQAIDQLPVNPVVKDFLHSFPYRL